jgi:hypothetical protein
MWRAESRFDGLLAIPCNVEMQDAIINREYVLFNMTKKKHKFLCCIAELHYICTQKKIVSDFNGSKGIISNDIEGSCGIA